MIVPHSAICTDRMAEVQTVLFGDNKAAMLTSGRKPKTEDVVLPEEEIKGPLRSGVP